MFFLLRKNYKALYFQFMETKFCNVCEQLTEKTNFNKRKNSPDGLKTICKPCERTRNRDYYFNRIKNHNHKDLKIKYRKKTHNINKEYILDYLKSNPCVDCGETDILVLEFDHVRGIKTKAISKMIRDYSFQSLKEEIEKCDIRCVNCHRVKTAIERKTWKSDLL